MCSCRPVPVCSVDLFLRVTVDLSRDERKDGLGPSSVRRTLELFQSQRSGNFRETGHMGFPERMKTVLN